MPFGVLPTDSSLHYTVTNRVYMSNYRKMATQDGIRMLLEEVLE